MSSSEDRLVSKVDLLHAILNQIYALDSNWRNWGKWPSDVTGSILHVGATSDAIAEAESRFGHRFPPSYKEFLNLHRSWEHFWADFTLLGTGSPETKRAQDEIGENIEYQASRLRKRLGDNFSAGAVATWESEKERHLYLAHHLVIGTNFSGAHWVYDTRTRREDGELTLVHWDISYGAQDPKFATFHEFLDWAVFVAGSRLEQLKDILGTGAEGEGETAPPGARKSRATRKRSPKRGAS